MKTKDSHDVVQALFEADRNPGWNNRSRTSRRFDIPGGFGFGCELYVVPYRRFAYNRQEKAAGRHMRARRGPDGSAA